LVGLALGLALLLWLPIGLLGAPLDTPDGFLHLGWAVAWARQIRGGWLWPLWSDLNWAGAGSAALAIYPPLFRLLAGIPMVLGVPAARALELALLLVLVIDNVGAACLARVWLPPGRWRWLLVGLAGINPYFFVNLYVRGAWPEALAQGLLWWLALGWLGLGRNKAWGLPVGSLALAAIVLSNWNSALLSLVAWGAGLVLLVQRRPNWVMVWRWIGVPLGGLTLSAPFWIPALGALASVRPPIPSGLYRNEFFLHHHPGSLVLADLLWIQAATVLVLLLVRWLGWGWRGLQSKPQDNEAPDWQQDAPLAAWGLLLVLMGLLLMLPVGEPIYRLLPPLQRIQFPWRWLGPTWFGALLWLTSAGTVASQEAFLDQGRNGFRRGAFLAAIALAAVLWLDSLSRFRTNLVGHHPSAQERQALNRLLTCDPLVPCPDGVNVLPPTGELSKRFVALGDGRIALTGVPDYSPAGIPELSWVRRLQTFWIPAWPQETWASFTGEGMARLISHGPTSRLVLVEAKTPGRLRLMQWAYPAWTIQIRREGTERWGTPMAFTGPRQARDQDGWVSVPLEPGVWEVGLTYGRSL
jgi:hypothetical protein